MWCMALGEFCFREEFLAPNKSESHRSQEDDRLKKVTPNAVHLAYIGGKNSIWLNLPARAGRT